MRLSILYGILLGTAFAGLFPLTAPYLTGIFLHGKALVAQAGRFLSILCLPATTLGVINMVTSYFQALGKASPSLAITVLRNAVLFVPAIILLNRLWGLTGVIAAQPVMEVLLMGIALTLYGLESRTAGSVRKGATHGAKPLCG